MDPVPGIPRTHFFAVEIMKRDAIPAVSFFLRSSWQSLFAAECQCTRVIEFLVQLSVDTVLLINKTDQELQLEVLSLKFHRNSMDKSMYLQKIP